MLPWDDAKVKDGAATVCFCVPSLRPTPAEMFAVEAGVRARRSSVQAQREDKSVTK